MAKHRTPDQMRAAGYKNLTHIDPGRRVMTYMSFKTKTGTWTPVYGNNLNLLGYQWEPDNEQT